MSDIPVSSRPSGAGIVTVDIPYGAGLIPVHIDKGRLRAVIRPNEQPHSVSDETEIIRSALLNPTGSPRLSELARGKKRICIITSDHTRPLPSRLTMPLLLEEIRRGEPSAEITVLIATGMHRAPTQEELIARFGSEIAETERIVIHDSRNDAEMVFLGKLPSGGDLICSKLAVEADLLVAEGFIEPHFFAGFSGGRKSVLPGIASEKTVRYNHNAAFIADEHARQGVLEENPIHRDMCFAAKAAGLRFILNVLLDEEKKVIAAFAGDTDKAHHAGCSLCLDQARVPRTEADIVITSNGGAPLDQNLYQSVKGMTTAEVCVREGGVIIMCAEAADGHGGEAFLHWFADRSGPRRVMDDILSIPAEDTIPDQWQAQILARVMLKAACIFVTGEKNRPLVESMHMLWAPDPDTALVMAEKHLGRAGSVTVIPNGVGVICVP